MATIFIVDDEPMLHELYGDILELSGHEVVANTYDGDEAVEIFKTMNEPPEVVIMDHRMPNKNGIETTEEILKIDPNMKIIFASADAAIKNDAIAAGACAFLSKPFSVSNLLAMLEEMTAE